MTDTDWWWDDRIASMVTNTAEEKEALWNSLSDLWAKRADDMPLYVWSVLTEEPAMYRNAYSPFPAQWPPVALPPTAEPR